MDASNTRDGSKIPDAFLLVGPPPMPPTAKTSCFLWFHNWGKWDEPFSFGYEDYQRRVCIRCGKRAQRKIGWYTKT